MVKLAKRLPVDRIDENGLLTVKLIGSEQKVPDHVLIDTQKIKGVTKASMRRSKLNFAMIQGVDEMEYYLIKNILKVRR